MKNKDVLVLTMGGTINAEYNGYDGEKGCCEENLVARIVEDHAFNEKRMLRVESFSNKFSDDVTNDELQKVAEIIANASEDRIVITTGTNLMVQHARALSTMLRSLGVEKKKSVVFTGAITPISEGEEKTDGIQNILDAIEVAVHNARGGVCIVMHRQVFDPVRTAKNFERQVFSETITRL